MRDGDGDEDIAGGGDEKKTHGNIQQSKEMPQYIHKRARARARNSFGAHVCVSDTLLLMFPVDDVRDGKRNERANINGTASGTFRSFWHFIAARNTWPHAVILSLSRLQSEMTWLI